MIDRSGKKNPFYGKHHSKETIKLISDKNKGKYTGDKNPFYGKRHSEESIKLMSEKKKGRTPWNKGKTGIYSKETLESNRQKHLGKKHSEEHNKKIGESLKGRVFTEEHKRKIGEKTKARCIGKPLQEVYGLIGAVEKRAKIFTNNWPKKMKGNFPQSTLDKKSANTKGELNPMHGVRGDQHPSWLGGLKLLPYDKKFTKWFKEEIRKRDGYECLKCGMSNEDHKRLFRNQSLQIHHINYDKELSIPENCCALCCRCNNKVNFNRNYWKKYFQSALSEIFDYKYKDGEPVIYMDKISRIEDEEKEEEEAKAEEDDEEEEDDDEDNDFNEED